MACRKGPSSLCPWYSAPWVPYAPFLPGFWFSQALRGGRSCQQWAAEEPGMLPRFKLLLLSRSAGMRESPSAVPSFLLTLLRFQRSLSPKPAPLGVPHLWFSHSPERAQWHHPQPTLTRLPRGHTCVCRVQRGTARAWLQGTAGQIWNQR